MGIESKKIKHKHEELVTLNFLLKVSIITWFLFCFYIFIQLFYPFTVYKYNQYPLPIIEKTVRTGEEVHFLTDYCKYTGATSNITFSFQRKLSSIETQEGIADVSINFEPLHDVNTPSGCHQVIRKLRVPIMIRPGTYRIIQNISSHINNFRTFNGEFMSVWFNIVN